MMAGWKIVTLVGLFLNLVGVILLFFYVLPRRERTRGHSPHLDEYWKSESGINQTRKTLGYFQLGSGSGASLSALCSQGVGVWLSP
jgi:hypothetical protein